MNLLAGAENASAFFVALSEYSFGSVRLPVGISKTEKHSKF